MPLLQKLKFPGNAMMLTQFLIKIATFDLIPTEHIDQEMYYFPDSDPYTSNFEQVGIESTLFLANIGFAMYLILAHAFFIVLHACLYRFRYVNSCTKKLYTKLSSYMYWNGLLRFYMEVYFDFAIMSILNLEMADWET